MIDGFIEMPDGTRREFVYKTPPPAAIKTQLDAYRIMCEPCADHVHELCNRGYCSCRKDDHA